MRFKLAIYASILFILMFSIDFVLQKSLQKQYYSQSVVNVSQRLAPIRVSIEKEIVSNLLLIQGTANYISVHPQISEQEFNLYAEGALHETTLLRNLGAAPGFIMRYVYPLLGNEKILGVDYRNLPEQWPQVKRAWLSDSMMVAGPIALLQGGKGLIGRAPVFIKDGEPNTAEHNRFWGIVSAVIDADRLFRIVGLNSITDLRIAIRGVDGKGADGAVFWGDASLFDPSGKPILAEISFPSGSWQIAALPTTGWAKRHPAAFQIHFFTFLLSCIFLYAGYRDLQNRHDILRAKDTLDEAQALAHLGNWNHDVKSGSIWWSDETYRIFGVTKFEFTPSLNSFFNMVHPEDRELVQEAYSQSIENRERFTTDHRIVRPDGSIRHVHEHGSHQYDDKGKVIRSFGTVHDITARKVIARDLLAEQAKLRAMAEATYDPLIMIDSTDTILFWSPAAERAFGWTQAEAVGQKMHPLITPHEYLEPAQEGLRRFAKTGVGPVLDSIMEFPAIRKNGDLFPVERSVSAFQVEGVNYAVGMLRDVTERKRNEEKLARMATTDALTGLLNRRRFIELVEAEIKRCQRHGCQVSLIMFDADKFKNINDTYGHAVGDDVLIAIASTTQGCLREVDSLGRIGGEEFVILLPETPLVDALVVAERIRKTIEQIELSLDDGNAVNFTVSLGVTQFLQEEAGFDTFLKRADAAMYKAKENGRNRVESA